MRKNSFNFFLHNSLEKFVVIALFIVLSPCSPIQAASYSVGPTAIPCPTPTALTPIWGRLVLSGNTVTCYYGMGLTTPTTWTQIGLPETINFINDPILVGVFLSSHNSAALSNGTIDNFSISPAPTYRLADCDIGSPTYMGSANLINNVWNLSGCGANVWNTSDQCNFQSWLVWGDCTVICRVTSISTGSAYQKIGIMIRDGFNSGSDYALFCDTAGEGAGFEYRPSFNDNPDVINYVVPPAPGVKSGVAVGYGLTGGTTYTLRP
jgi:hypothetical protein